MQVTCFLMGSIALFMVRRQKISNTTLFDQRKARGASKHINGSIEHQSVEMVHLQESEPNTHAIEGDESAPLTLIGTPSKPLYIV